MGFGRWMRKYCTGADHSDHHRTEKGPHAKLRLAMRKQNELKDLFRTMLHELMTASIRVHEFELEIEN